MRPSTGSSAPGPVKTVRNVGGAGAGRDEIMAGSTRTFSRPECRSAARTVLSE
jgi:hypothetical protein